MSAFKYFTKTVPGWISRAQCTVGEGLYCQNTVSASKKLGGKTTQVNARMATVDRDGQGQATHRQYELRTV